MFYENATAYGGNNAPFPCQKDCRLFGVNRGEGKLGYVEKTRIQQLELGNDGEREERQRHERLLFPVSGTGGVICFHQRGIYSHSAAASS